MFYMTAYFVSAYGAVTLLLRLLLRRRTASDRVATNHAGWRLTPPLLLLLPLVPYALVAIQTEIALPALQPALQAAIEKDCGIRVQPRTVRVLRVLPVPVVYAVLPCTGMAEHGEVGTLYTFRRVKGAWQWDGVPDCAWSDCGSADGNTFPPYPEAKEF